MWIYLLRHGIAEDPRPGIADDDRALTDEGREGLRDARHAWSRLVQPPDLVITSPLRRARETADIFRETFDAEPPLRVEAAIIPGAEPARVVTLLESEMLSQTRSVAVVGHEPNIGYLFGALLTGQLRISVSMERGMLVGLQSEGATSLITGLRFVLRQQDAARIT